MKFYHSHTEFLKITIFVNVSYTYLICFIKHNLIFLIAKYDYRKHYPAIRRTAEVFKSLVFQVAFPSVITIIHCMIFNFQAMQNIYNEKHVFLLPQIFTPIPRSNPFLTISRHFLCICTHIFWQFTVYKYKHNIHIVYTLPSFFFWNLSVYLGGFPHIQIMRI